MRKNPIYNMFIFWYRKNKHRFPIQTEVIFKKGGVFLLELVNIKTIEISFDRDGIDVCAEYEGEFYDYLRDGDLYEKKSNKGYYCDLCYDHKMRVDKEFNDYFATREELWITHAFEPLLEWIVKNIQEERYLCFYRYMDDGYPSHAKLLNYEKFTTMNSSDRMELVFYEKLQPVWITNHID